MPISPEFRYNRREILRLLGITALGVTANAARACTLSSVSLLETVARSFGRRKRPFS